MPNKEILVFIEVYSGHGWPNIVEKPDSVNVLAYLFYFSSNIFLEFVEDIFRT
jgi:hypothetical protein